MDVLANNCISEWEGNDSIIGKGDIVTGNVSDDSCCKFSGFVVAVDEIPVSVPKRVVFIVFVTIGREEEINDGKISGNNNVS